MSKGLGLTLSIGCSLRYEIDMHVLSGDQLEVGCRGLEEYIIRHAWKGSSRDSML